MTRSPHDLTEAQLEILDLLWSQGEGTISYLWEELRKRRKVARNTVLTLVTRLEERGFLKRKPRGRTYVYRCRVQRSTVETQRLRSMLDQLFQGSPEKMVRSLLGHEMVSPDEFKNLRRLLDEEEARRKKEES